MIHLRRRVFKTQTTGESALRELLQTMFVSEILLPEQGKELWVVSPWISDIPLVDNRSGNFDSVNPEWGRREIRLAEILGALIVRGSSLVIVTRSDQTNVAFLGAMREVVAHSGVPEKLRVVIRNELHAKGIVLSRSQLFGSMNLTFNGLQILEESVEYSIDLEEVALRRNEFRDAYAG
jgi:hypothetical protein